LEPRDEAAGRFPGIQRTRAFSSLKGCGRGGRAEVRPLRHAPAALQAAPIGTSPGPRESASGLVPGLRSLGPSGRVGALLNELQTTCRPGTPAAFSSETCLVLSQLPCWKHLTPEAYRTRVAEIMHQVEATAAAERADKGVEPLGTEKILAQDPETRPETLDRSPAPSCTPRRGGSARSSGRRTAGSWPPTERRQRDSGTETGTPPFRPAASRPTCHSSRPEPRS
jgi:hypothetical protein